MNSFFETTHLFSSYNTEHVLLLISFLSLMILFIRMMKSRPEAYQRRVLLGIAVVLSLTQLAKIPLNLYAGTFDATKDIPLHMCNFLPFILIGVYSTKNRTVWATVFFWIVLGVSQSNFTPTVQYSLFHYDAIRYWMVHMGLVLLGIYPAINWGWELKFKDVGRTFIWLNVAAGIIYCLNLGLGSNYLYIMAKPPGATFFSILPPWPTYILVLEVIVIVWSLIVYGIFKMISRQVEAEAVPLETTNG